MMDKYWKTIIQSGKILGIVVVFLLLFLMIAPGFGRRDRTYFTRINLENIQRGILSYTEQYHQLPETYDRLPFVSEHEYWFSSYESSEPRPFVVAEILPEVILRQLPSANLPLSELQKLQNQPLRAVVVMPPRECRDIGVYQRILLFSASLELLFDSRNTSVYLSWQDFDRNVKRSGI